jgi:hypothetical protein
MAIYYISARSFSFRPIALEYVVAKKIFIVIAFLLVFINFGGMANAATQVTPTTSTTTSSTGVKCANDETGINTAIGCIHVLGSSEEFLSDILRWAVGIGGGIAFLLILYAGFMIMTASGSPDRLKAGQELLTSAISGLILLVFSIFILKFIGVDILGLGAFGFGK